MDYVIPYDHIMDITHSNVTRHSSPQGLGMRLCMTFINSMCGPTCCPLMPGAPGPPFNPLGPYIVKVKGYILEQANRNVLVTTCAIESGQKTNMPHFGVLTLK